jgi:hypothetical protein
VYVLVAAVLATCCAGAVRADLHNKEEAQNRTYAPGHADYKEDKKAELLLRGPRSQHGGHSRYGYDQVSCNAVKKKWGDIIAIRYNIYIKCDTRYNPRIFFKYNINILYNVIPIYERFTIIFNIIYN